MDCFTKMNTCVLYLKIDSIKKSGNRFDFQLFRPYYMSTDYKIVIDSKSGAYLNRVLPEALTLSSVEAMY